MFYVQFPRGRQRLRVRYFARYEVIFRRISCTITITLYIDIHITLIQLHGHVDNTWIYFVTLQRTTTYNSPFVYQIRRNRNNCIEILTPSLLLFFFFFYITLSRCSRPSVRESTLRNAREWSSPQWSDWQNVSFLWKISLIVRGDFSSSPLLFPVYPVGQSCFTLL